MSDKNIEIKKAIDSFDVESARTLLREALKEANAETYYLASLVALDDEQKKSFLQKALSIDPFHEKSHAALKRNNSVVAVNSTTSPIKENLITTSESYSEVNDINKFITALVQGDTDNISMHIIPIETGLIRTQLRKGSKIFLIERDERAEWFLCGYLSPIGQPIIGWLPYVNLQDVNYLRNEINLLDLPITRFEPYNTRTDVQRLIEEKKKKLQGTRTAVANVMVTGFLAIFVTFFSFIFLVVAAAVGDGTMLFGVLFGGGVLLVISIFSYSKYKKILDSINESNAPYKEEIKRLDLFHKEMRSEYERLRDDQRFTMGIQAGLDTAKNLVGIAGNTVASKILTASKQPKSKKK